MTEDGGWGGRGEPMTMASEDGAAVHCQPAAKCLDACPRSQLRVESLPHEGPISKPLLNSFLQALRHQLTSLPTLGVLPLSINAGA